MKSFVFTITVLVGLLGISAVWADTDCNVEVAKWQSRDVLRVQLEQQGMHVQRIKVDDGCYEVRGVNAEGDHFKAKYSPDKLLVLKMKIKHGRQGEPKHRNKKNLK